MQPRTGHLWRGKPERMTNMNDIVQLVNEASQKDDRWLFLFFAFLLLALGAWVLRHFMAQNKDLVSQLRSEQVQHEETLTGIIAKQNETEVQLAVSLDHNATAYKECSAQLELCRQQQRKGN